MFGASRRSAPLFGNGKAVRSGGAAAIPGAGPAPYSKAAAILTPGSTTAGVASGTAGRGCQQHGCRRLCCNRNPICKTGGCGRVAKSQGLCVAHGAYGICSIAGCGAYSTSRAHSKCGKHANKPKCSTESCNNLAKSHGICALHGAFGECTSATGCKKPARDKRGGLCNRHRFGTCRMANCLDSAHVRGLCKAHKKENLPGPPLEPPPIPLAGHTRQPGRIGSMVWSKRAEEFDGAYTEPGADAGSCFHTTCTL